MAGATDLDKRESGSALIVIGLGVLLADLLVVFFAPAGFRVGRQSAFMALVLVLAVLGLGCVLVGRGRRRRATWATGNSNLKRRGKH